MMGIVIVIVIVMLVMMMMMLVLVRRLIAAATTTKLRMRWTGRASSAYNTPRASPAQSRRRPSAHA